MIDGLPKGWETSCLEEMTNAFGGGTPPKAESRYWLGGTIPWVSPKDMKTHLITDSEDHVTEMALDRLNVVPVESVLVVVRSGILSRTLPVARTKVPVTVNQDMRAFMPLSGISSSYIAWQLISGEREILERCSKDGTTVASIEGPALARFPLKVAPSGEQIRIVAKLEELLSDLDAGVAELKAAQKKLQLYRQSLLKAAVEGTLTAPWREAQRKLVTPLETGAQLLQRILTERRARWEAKQLAKFNEQGKAQPKDWQKKYPEPVQPEITDLPELPAGWVWASVDQCSLDERAITDGPFGSNLKSEHYRDSGPRVIRLQNIGDGVFVDSYAHISEVHFADLSKHAVETGDVVAAMLGEVLPRACTVPNGVAPAIVKADCARIRLNVDLMCSAIVVAQLNSKPIRDAVMKFVKGIGRPRINLGHVRAIPIALAPRDEQVATETALRDAQLSIEEQLSAINLSLKQSTAQRQNVLRAAFAGQLVPQDSNDEPARVLLERIRAERAERAKQPKVRRTKHEKEIAAVVRKLIDVLEEAGDWMPAQEAFRRCGVNDGAETERIEELYAELRKLDKAGRLAVEAVTDARGRKLHDKLKLLAG